MAVETGERIASLEGQVRTLTSACEDTDQRLRVLEAADATIKARIESLMPLPTKIDALTARLDRLDGAMRMAMWVVPTATAVAVALTKFIPWLLHIEQVTLR